MISASHTWIKYIITRMSPEIYNSITKSISCLGVNQGWAWSTIFLFFYSIEKLEYLGGWWWKLWNIWIINAHKKSFVSSFETVSTYSRVDPISYWDSKLECGVTWFSRFEPTRFNLGTRSVKVAPGLTPRILSTLSFLCFFFFKQNLNTQKTRPRFLNCNRKVIRRAIEHV